MHDFKKGDIVRRRPGTANGVYEAEVLDVEDDVLSLRITQTLTRHSFPNDNLKPGSLLQLTSSKFEPALPRDSDKPLQALAEAYDTLAKRNCDLHAEIIRLRKDNQNLRDRAEREALNANALRTNLRAVRKLHDASPRRAWRHVLVVLTPPGVEPSESVWGSTAADADLIVAGSVDDSYVKVLKSRDGMPDDTKVTIRWER